MSIEKKNGLPDQFQNKDFCEGWDEGLTLGLFKTRLSIRPAVLEVSTWNCLDNIKQLKQLKSVFVCVWRARAFVCVCVLCGCEYVRV